MNRSPPSTPVSNTLITFRVVETGEDLRLLLEPGDRAGIPVVEGPA